MNPPISPIRILPAEISPARMTDGLSPGVAGPDGQGDFFTTLKQSMDAVEGVQGEAQNQVAALLSGKGEDLHTAMIAVEKADLSFQLMMQVRNKIVQAYQQISSMQF